MVKRSCGECKACCTVMGVEELSKDPYIPCKHLCSSGCGIYGSHPPSCKEFECVWRSELIGEILREEERPDKTGIVILPSANTEIHALLGCIVLVAHEVFAGAVTAYAGDKLLKRLSSRFLVIIRPVGANISRTIIGPKVAMMKANKFIARGGFFTNV